MLGLFFTDFPSTGRLHTGVMSREGVSAQGVPAALQPPVLRNDSALASVNHSFTSIWADISFITSNLLSPPATFCLLMQISDRPGPIHGHCLLQVIKTYVSDYENKMLGYPKSTVVSYLTTCSFL